MGGILTPPGGAWGEGWGKRYDDAGSGSTDRLAGETVARGLSRRRVGEIHAILSGGQVDSGRALIGVGETVAHNAAGGERDGGRRGGAAGGGGGPRGLAAGTGTEQIGAAGGEEQAQGDAHETAPEPGADGLHGNILLGGDVGRDGEGRRRPDGLARTTTDARGASSDLCRNARAAQEDARGCAREAARRADGPYLAA